MAGNISDTVKGTTDENELVDSSGLTDDSPEAVKSEIEAQLEEIDDNLAELEENYKTQKEEFEAQREQSEEEYEAAKEELQAKREQSEEEYSAQKEELETTKAEFEEQLEELDSSSNSSSDWAALEERKQGIAEEINELQEQLLEKSKAAHEDTE